MSSGFDFSAFIAGFQEEAEERLQSIESTLVDLEQGSLDADRLEKLRRDAHSVKGSANMLQLQDIGESAHVLEDTFAYLRDGSAVPDQAHMNFMFNLLDSLRNRIATAADSAAEQLDPEALREQLENLDSATAEMEAAPAEAEPEATEAEPAVIEPAPEGEGAPPAGEETPTTEEPATGEADGTAAGDEVSAASVDWSRFIPGVREEAHPILSQVQQGLAAEEGIALEAEKLDELERVALSLRQVALEDAAEVLDLVASVLESPASHSLPPALLEVLQGLIQRVRRRLDQADQPGAAPLDRQRIGQARQLLERWGMVPAPGDSAPEGGSAPAEAPAPAASEAAEEEPPAIAEPGQGPTSRTAAPGESNMDVSAFLEGFQAEARELLNVIQDGLLKAEHGDLSRETLDAMKQKAHGLKGSANMLGLEDLGNGAELLEEGFKALTAGGGDGPDYQGLLELHDALRDAAEQVQNPDRPHLDADQWRQRLQRRSPQTTAAPAAESSPDSSPPPSEGAEAPANGDNKPKNSGNRGTMRVSADRLERLSDGVIGLAMDRATQEDRRSDLDQLVADFRSLRQQWEWFEQILPETGPLVEQKKKLSGQLESLNQQLRQFRQQTELDIAARHSLYDEIHQRVMDLMVTPLGNIFSVLPRSARDLAQRFQKRVELTIDGSEIELERRNVDALLEPLVHLVTNAISHGIEDAEERKAAGKDPVGHIRVQAQQVGGEVAISVSDDGRGIDYEKVRETAIRTGVTTAAEAENMLPYDLLQMLFRPGFSTKEEVSQISGR
ncbi:MAG TPA: Hpt domain-containing protein, partial [Gammaproteobacteria bacterium]|nr:Hpt domain-containing protein [Gammaproteobacteria bacterium]